MVCETGSYMGEKNGKFFWFFFSEINFPDFSISLSPWQSPSSSPPPWWWSLFVTNILVVIFVFLVEFNFHSKNKYEKKMETKQICNSEYVNSECIPIEWIDSIIKSFSISFSSSSRHVSYFKTYNKKKAEYNKKKQFNLHLQIYSSHSANSLSILHLKLNGMAW